MRLGAMFRHDQNVARPLSDGAKILILASPPSAGEELCSAALGEPPPPSSAMTTSPTERLSALRDLRDQDLISTEQYQAAVQSVLAELTPNADANPTPALADLGTTTAEAPASSVPSSSGGVLSGAGDGAAEEPPVISVLTPGDEIGQYRILRELGAGGFSVVYEAEHKLHGHKRAMKVVLAEPGSPGTAAKQMLFEWKEQLAIDNWSHVIGAEAPEEHDVRGMRLIAMPMELADGGDLRRWLVNHPDLATRRKEGLRFWHAACDGVAAIHAAGLVHRDLKPENLLLCGDTIKVTDLGLAQSLTESGGAATPSLEADGVGTPAYMAPEQFRAAHAADIDERADLWALGVILFEIVTGRTPFGGASAQIRDNVLDERVAINFEAVPDDLRLLLQSLLVRPASDRPRTIAAMRNGPDKPESDGLPPGTVEVAPSDAEFTSIQAGLDAVATGGIVLVRAGTYNESLIITNAAELRADGKGAVRVIGQEGAPGLSCQGVAARVVGLEFVGRSASAILVQGGQATFEACAGTTQSGDDSAGNIAGIEVMDGAEPTVSGCTFHDNDGAGVIVREASKGTFEACNISANKGAGVVLRDGSNPTIRNSKISECGAGVVVRESARGIFESCEIFGNTVAGIEVKTNGDPTVRGCKVNGGKNAGVFVHQEGRGTFENCDIASNAVSGVDIHESGDSTLKECTISKNGQAGIYVLSGGRATLDDCELRKNKHGLFIDGAHATVAGGHIFLNNDHGIVVQKGAEIVAERVDISRNGKFGVGISKNSKASFDTCSLPGNQGGAWSVGKHCSVRRRRCTS